MQSMQNLFYEKFKKYLTEIVFINIVLFFH